MTMIIEDLVRNVLDTKFTDFKDETIEDARKRIIDVISCAIGGANASGNSALLNLIRRWAGSKEATILAHGDRVPLHNAVMMNSLMARSFDYEGTGPEPEGEEAGRMTGHVCSTTEPTALSVAEHKRSSGKELLAAVILGGDLAARMAATEDFAFSSSFELTGTVNAFGAAALTSRLWGLDEQQLINAFGIVVNSVAGTFQNIWDGAHTFKLPGALSARNAIFAVELSSEGFTGIKDPLFSPQGYYPQYCKSYHPEYLTRDLGKVFYVKAQHKTHPSCNGNHNSIDCCLEILQQHDINAKDIAEIVVTGSESRRGHFLYRPFEAGDSAQKSLFNIPYAVANVLLRGSAEIEHYTDEFVNDPEVIELARKVKLETTLPPDYAQRVRVKVKMEDGREFSAERKIVRGWLDNPVTKEEIKDKFWNNVNYSKTVSRKNAQKALDMFENLEEVNDVSEIVKLLVA